LAVLVQDTATFRKIQLKCFFKNVVEYR
jgi:hypothetical protein